MTQHTAEEQLTFFKQIRLLILPATFGFGAWTWWELTQLERGAQESVSTWTPIAWMYEGFGFWPAVLVMPGLGVILFVAIRRKIKKAEDLSRGS